MTVTTGGYAFCKIKYYFEFEPYEQLRPGSTGNIFLQLALQFAKRCCTLQLQRLSRNRISLLQGQDASTIKLNWCQQQHIFSTCNNKSC